MIDQRKILANKTQTKNNKELYIYKHPEIHKYTTENLKMREESINNFDKEYNEKAISYWQLQPIIELTSRNKYKDLAKKKKGEEEVEANKCKDINTNN